MVGVILETVHGSHLYGFAHADSDYDFYRVITGGKTMQTVTGKQDIMQVEFKDFQRLISLGTHQALEALYSPIKTVDNRWQPYFTGFHPDLGQMVYRYTSAITNFGTRHQKTPILNFAELQLKPKRHMLRLADNLGEYMTKGYFNPRLSTAKVNEYTDLATNGSAPEFERELRTLCPVELPPFLWSES